MDDFPEGRFVYALEDLHVTLMTPMLAAGVVIYVTSLIRGWFPGLKKRQIPLVTLVIGIGLELGAMYAGFLPAGVTWQAALLLGIATGVTANGTYSGFKAVTSHEDGNAPVMGARREAGAVTPPTFPYKNVAILYRAPMMGTVMAESPEDLNETILGYPLAVVRGIINWADANLLPPLVLLAMAIQESGGKLNPYAAGDWNGREYTSFGIFQIHTPAHGGPPERWTGIAGMFRAMAQMKSRWQHYFSVHGGWAEWIANVIQFQRDYTPDAQGSIAWTEELAAVRFGEALRIYVEYLKMQQGSSSGTVSDKLLLTQLEHALAGLTLTQRGIGDVLQHLNDVQSGVEHALTTLPQEAK
jgi:hypothetical protein